MYIKTYQRNGKLASTDKLTNENLAKIAGMLSKVILKNGNFVVGYIDPLRIEGKKEEYDGTVHDYIYLWTFKNLDEEKQKHDIKDGFNIEKVIISDIEDVHSILHSHPRWGGRITNKFWIDIE
jgi:hypothetical protein